MAERILHAVVDQRDTDRHLILAWLGTYRYNVEGRQAPDQSNRLALDALNRLHEAARRPVGRR